MPISRDQFDREENTRDYLLRNLFLENPDKAFSVQELLEKFKISEVTEKYNIIITMITWSIQGFLEAKSIDNITYYALKRNKQ